MKCRYVVIRFQARDNKEHDEKWFLDRIDMNTLEMIGEPITKKVQALEEFQEMALTEKRFFRMI
ncbi:MAG: hypothetical protein JRI72_17030 [Deltaproteobacteria bacterium]|nr:hypothetical protein [Deltaproteobacteria bacterium]